MRSRLLLLPAAFATLLVPACSTGGAPSTAAVPPAEAELRELLRKADDWEVPQPSSSASLINVWAFGGTKGPGSRSKDYYLLGFADSVRKDHVLVGFEEKVLLKGEKTKSAETPPDLSDVTCESPFETPQGVNVGLVTGIQMLRRGQSAEGKALIAKSLTEEAGHSYSSFRIPTGEPVVTTLARCCLADAINDINTPKPDYSHILRRTKRLLSDQPKLRSEATDWAVKSLSAAVKHRPAAKGSTEALIEDYLRCGEIHGTLAFNPDGMPAARRALASQGFEAIPAILRQIDSPRVTNHRMQGFNNFPSYPMEAGAVLQDYLQSFANDEFGSNWLERQKGVSASRAVQAWWRKAKKTGEEAYVAEHIIRPDPDQKDRVILSEELLVLQQARYPKQLPDTYRRMLRSSTYSNDVADALRSCEALPRETRLQLLDEGIATRNPAHRDAARREKKLLK